MSKTHPNNGGTFTKGKRAPRKRPPDEEPRLDPSKPEMFVSQRSREVAHEIMEPALKDPGKLHFVARKSASANWKKVLGALKAGQWTWAKVPQGKNCHVDLRGKYADGKSADVSNVDICTDKTVDLVN